ncbi:SYVM protein, partial [Rhodinocichla rosea]|nr:SYVM protein [Rhodinocichla rosea]
PEIRVGVASVLTQRRFCNTPPNALGFVLRALQGHGDPPDPPQETPPISSVLTPDFPNFFGFSPHPPLVPVAPLDRWLLSRLAGAPPPCGRRLEALEVHGAVATVPPPWLRSFCDVYLVWEPQKNTP